MSDLEKRVAELERQQDSMAKDIRYLMGDRSVSQPAPPLSEAYFTPNSPIDPRPPAPEPEQRTVTPEQVERGRQLMQRYKALNTPVQNLPLLLHQMERWIAAVCGD